MTSDSAPRVYEGEELQALRDACRYQEWIAEQFQPFMHGTLMELGAGIGTMAPKWLGHAEHLHLIEPAPNLYPELRARFGSDPRVTLHSGVLQDVAARAGGLTSRSVDGVVTINVLEHIEDDAAALQLMHELLKPRGHLMVFVPAMPSLYGSLDRRFGHHRRYTRSGLVSLCEQAGYETICVRYFDVFGVAPWWLVNRVFRSEHLSTRLAGVYDRYVVPSGRWLEKRIGFGFGKNLIYVGRRS